MPVRTGARVRLVPVRTGARVRLVPARTRTRAPPAPALAPARTRTRARLNPPRAKPASALAPHRARARVASTPTPGGEGASACGPVTWLKPSQLASPPALARPHPGSRHCVRFAAPPVLLSAAAIRPAFPSAPAIPPVLPSASAPPAETAPDTPPRLRLPTPPPTDGRGGLLAQSAGGAALLGDLRRAVICSDAGGVSRSNPRRSTRHRHPRRPRVVPGPRPSRPPRRSTGASPCRRGPWGRWPGRRTPPWGGSVRRCRRRSGSGTRSEACPQVNGCPPVAVGTRRAPPPVHGPARGARARPGRGGGPASRGCRGAGPSRPSRTSRRTSGPHRRRS